MGEEVISTLKPYDLRNIFHKTIAALISDSSDGQGKLKTLLESISILDAIKDICDSWEDKHPINRNLKEVIPILRDSFEGSRF